VRHTRNVGKTNLPVLINSHSGGAVIQSHKTEHNWVARIATDHDVVVFNVDYRLAPETKTPGGPKDTVAAFHHAHQNAEKYGINPDKISLMGSSGGGFIAMVASILLAREEKANLVKLLLLFCPMLSGELDYRVPENTM